MKSGIADLQLPHCGELNQKCCGEMRGEIKLIVISYWLLVIGYLFVLRTLVLIHEQPKERTEVLTTNFSSPGRKKPGF